MSTQPLVSIGIPTYNRSELLKRAIESAMGQDYPNLEIVISDNVSTDDTAAVCAHYAAIDPRVRYIRQNENRGATGNFKDVSEKTSGEFFAWLGDDDWMDKNFVSSCVEYLMSHPDYSVVGGRVRYYENDQFLFEEEPTNLTDEVPFERVRNFYRHVRTNGIFYGVIRRTCLEQAPIRKVSAFDWLVAAGLAGCGKCRTLNGIVLHRALGGATKDFGSIASSLKIPRILMFNDMTAYTVIAVLVFRHTAWTCPAYRAMGTIERHKLATRSAAIIMARYVTWRIKKAILPRRS